MDWPLGQLASAPQLSGKPFTRAHPLTNHTSHAARPRRRAHTQQTRSRHRAEPLLQAPLPKARPLLPSPADPSVCPAPSYSPLTCCARCGYATASRPMLAAAHISTANTSPAVLMPPARVLGVGCARVRAIKPPQFWSPILPVTAAWHDAIKGCRSDSAPFIEPPFIFKPRRYAFWDPSQPPAAVIADR